MTANTQLLQHRLHWYRSQMLVKLFRIKYAFIIFVMLFVQTIGHLKFLITKPILAAVDANSLGFLIGIQLTYIAWTILQHDAIQPKHVKSYLASLPISLRQNRFINLVILFVATNILWVPFLITFFITSHALNLLVLIASIFVAEIVWLENKIISFASIILFDATIYFTHSFVLSLFAITLLLFLNPALISNRINLSINLKILTKPFPLLIFQFLTLWRQYKIELITRSLLCLSIMLFGYAIVVFGGNVTSSAMTIIIVPSILLIFSGCYPLLNEIRTDNSLYLSSLPFSAKQWYALDYLLLMLIAIMFATILEAAFALKHQIQLINLLYLILMLPIGLILFCIRNYFVKQGTWIAAFFTVIFIIFMLSTVNGY